MAEAAFGTALDARTAWFEHWRHALRYDANGAAKVIDAWRHLLRTEKGRPVNNRERGYFRNNRHRLDAAAAAVGLAIGLGSVEAANKTLVTSHLKRLGQRWGPDGGQGVLSIRARCQSGRFDRAWEDLVPRRNRQSEWVPASPANDKRTLRLALVA